MKQTNSSLARLDYRLLAICALAPDLIDKPLAMVVFTAANTSQLVAHSLLLHVALLVGALLWLRPALPYVLAFNSHLLADRMWNHTETFWWPLFGWQTFWEFKPMNTPEAMVSVYWDILTNYPQVWVIELAALLFLLLFFIRQQWYRWPALKRLILTGRLSDSPPSAASPSPAATHRLTAPFHAADRSD